MSWEIAELKFIITILFILLSIPGTSFIYIFSKDAFSFWTSIDNEPTVIKKTLKNFQAVRLSCVALLF